MSNQELIEKVLKKEYKLKRILKDNNRSGVFLIEIENEEYVYKIPYEKNRRVWQRFLSIFRGSESKREYKSSLKIKESGFNGIEVITYYEKKSFGVCVDSFLLMRFIKGREATISDIKLVSKELERIHRKGFLHGDSQLSNFKIDENKIYIIDAKFMRNIYGRFGERYEFIYLEESCYRDIDYIKDDFYYRMAKRLSRFRHWIGRVKKRIRGKE